MRSSPARAFGGKTGLREHTSCGLSSSTLSSFSVTRIFLKEKLLPAGVPPASQIIPGTCSGEELLGRARTALRHARAQRCASTCLKQRRQAAQ